MKNVPIRKNFQSLDFIISDHNKSIKVRTLVRLGFNPMFEANLKNIEFKNLNFDSILSLIFLRFIFSDSISQSKEMQFGSKFDKFSGIYF
jgi:hypothetical protein